MSKSDTGESITHIAAGALCMAGRWIQRCGVCGWKLCDSKNVAIPNNRDGTPGEYICFPPGRLVRVVSGNPTSFQVLEDTDKIPEDSCLSLVEG